MVALSTAQEQELSYPSHGLNHHAEFVSLNTSLIVHCLFKMIVFLISLLTTLHPLTFEVFNFIILSLIKSVLLPFTSLWWGLKYTFCKQPVLSFS